MPRIEEILIPKSISDDYEAEPPFNSLAGIRKLNVIVGPNNSGKSRLLRELFSQMQHLLVSTDDSDLRKIRESVRSFHLALKDVWGNLNTSEARKILASMVSGHFGFHACGQRIVLENPLEANIQGLSEHFRRMSRADHGDQNHLRACCKSASENLIRINSSMKNLRSSSKFGQPENPELMVPLGSMEFVYIPTLRGMRLGSKDSELPFAYFDRTWNDYFSESMSERRVTIERARKDWSGKKICTGLDLYSRLRSRLLGTLADRDFIRNYEGFLSKRFFRGEPVTLIPREDHDTVNIKVGTEKERPVQKLGDGLQQLIILTLPIFEHKDKPALIFIEEPDLFLHPGYQRILIETILEEGGDSLHVFVATHSTQFLDITVSEENCAIFRCRKLPADTDHPEHDPKFEVKYIPSGDMELLKDIGVRPSSLMFANCTIWVEGITDRLYFARYLSLLIEEKNHSLTENLHYAFVEYGGNNITHWSFLDETAPKVERVCSKLCLIADKDEGKEDRHEKLKEALGEDLIILPVREAENLLKPETIKSVIRDYEGENFGLNHFDQSDYCDTLLGEFIDSKVLPDKTKSRRHRTLKTCYAAKSGTVKNKLDFCHRALDHINSVEDMSPHARELAEKMLEFILRENE